ncbi:alpha/beta fold hydrolase [Helcobacillus sp. ACRRO]|uniref:alpha/beta fold hydrolase n=1 Tax=Helcobacillus sp. ACRRO TaxID=2918202 RepID=UPI0031B87676
MHTSDSASRPAPFPFGNQNPSASLMPEHRIEDITIDVPLVNDDPSRGTIEVFARVITAPGGEDRPFLMYLQGGPGSEAPRPAPGQPAWVARLLEEYRVVMLDQRGTGRSTPVGLDLPFPPAPERTFREAIEHSADEVAEYLTHLRADEIVNDAEAIRRHLGAEQISTLGQSFGGFTTLAYLSAHPESLREVLITGGLAAVGRHSDEVYAQTWRIMREKSEAFYRRFPHARDRIRELMGLADRGEIRLPNGDAVTPARLRTLGHRLGSDDGFVALHNLLELDHRAPAFQHDLAALLPFTGRNPLYAVIHESCQADGIVTDWSAERTMPQDFHEDPTLLGGEHVHRSLFDEDSELAPWKPVAEILAGHQWGRVYDEDALRSAGVPGAAAVYFHDAFVPSVFSLETVALMPQVAPFVTSEYEHSGLRSSGDAVISHLIDLVKGRRVR